MFGRKAVHIEIADNEIRFLWKNNRLWHKSNNLLFHYEPIEQTDAEAFTPDVKAQAPDTKVLLSAAKFYVRDKYSVNSHLISILQEFREKYLNSKKAEAYLYIPFSRGLIREFTLPWIPSSNRDLAIQYYIEHEFPIAQSEFVYDYDIIESPTKESLLIRVAAIRNELLNFYTHCLRQAGYTFTHISYALNAMGETLGFDRISSESTSIESTNMESNRNKGILYLNGLSENRIQIVLFASAFPKLISETNSAPNDLSRYQLYLLLKSVDIPVTEIITNDTEHAKALEQIILEMGFVSADQKNECTMTVTGTETESKLPPNPEFVEKKTSFLESIEKLVLEQGVRSNAVLGGFIQSSQKRGINLCRSKIIARKLKHSVLVGCILGVLLLVQAVWQWYPKITEYNQLKKEVNSLQILLADLRAQQEKSFPVKWAVEQEHASKELESIKQVMSNLHDDLFVSRLNYQQGNLQLWAECNNNSVITSLIGRLSAEGWKDPVLVNYKYQPQKISFSITVKLKE